MIAKLLHHIPFQRLMLYGMLLCFLPALFIGIYFYSHIQNLNTLSFKIDQVQNLALQQEKRQANNLTVINHFKEADHFYIDKHLEVISLLEPEIDALQKIVQHNHFNDDEIIKKRLDYLSGSGNSLRFSEGVVQTFPQFQETIETLVHPVEVNLNDVQKILALVEGIAIGQYKPAQHRPQLIILDFKLERKKNPDKNEIFLMNMKLLKREFL